MIIFHAGVSPRPLSLFDGRHRLLSYYYVRQNKKDLEEVDNFKKDVRRDEKKKMKLKNKTEKGSENGIQL